MDVQSFPGLILFDVDDSFVNSPRCHDDDIDVLQGHLCCRILVPDCCDQALSIPSFIHDHTVGWSLLMENHTVDRGRDFMVHVMGEWHIIVAP